MIINKRWLSELNMTIDYWKKQKEIIEITIRILTEERDKANAELIAEIFAKSLGAE